MDLRLDRWLWLAVLLPFLSLAPATAQGDEGSVEVEAVFEPPTAKPGDRVVLVLKASTTPGFHAYGTKETTNLPVSVDPDDFELDGLEFDGKALVPTGKAKPGAFGTSYPLPAEFEVRQGIRVPADAEAREYVVEGGLGYQICTETFCLPPAKAEFTVKLQVAAASGQEPTTAAGKGGPALGFKPGLQLVPDAPKVKVEARFDPATARAGEATRVVLKVTVAEGWHAYGSKETVNVPIDLPTSAQDYGGLEAVGGPTIPPGDEHPGPIGKQYPLPQVFEVSQQLRVPADAKVGEVVASGAFHYQVCDATSCLPPGKSEWQAKLVVEAGEARAGAQPTASVDDVGEENGEDEDSPFASWWALILACIGGGLFALAMPCTYPMIPITFSFFTKQAEKRQGKVLPLAITYGVGIVVMFVVVGVVLSEAIIPIVNHWVTNAVIGVAFFFFAAVLFGWVNLNPPQFLQNAAGKASRTGGLLGVFFMGATLVITSFTCTAPIVGSLIAKVAEVGRLRVAIGMAVFGLTMALPFVWLSLAPGKVKALPRSGQWMETLKVSLGFVELAAAFKFVSQVDFARGWQVLPRELFLMLWTAIFGLWALYLFGILRKQGTPNEGVGSGRMAAGMTVTLLAAYFLFGALGNRLDPLLTSFVPAYSNSLIAKGGEKAHSKHSIVKDDPDAAIELAKRDDKLLLYNFTGFN